MLETLNTFSAGYNVTALLETSKDSEQQKTELNAAFVLAVQERSLERMEELIQAGANVKTPIPYTWTEGDCDWQIESTALIYAVRHGCRNMVKVLLKVDEQLSEALNEAIERGYSSVVEELINGGADVNYVNDRKETPLIKAVSSCRSGPQIIQALLKAGANVSHVNKYGKTALMVAVERHDFNTVKSLLEIPEMHMGGFFGFGTKPINYADEDGNTAIILAIKNVQYSYFDNHGYNTCKNSQSIIEALIETPGIDLHHVNENGETAITLLDKLGKKMNRYRY